MNNIIKTKSKQFHFKVFKVKYSERENKRIKFKDTCQRFAVQKLFKNLLKTLTKKYKPQNNEV